MKKILGLLTLVVIIVLGVFGYKYYSETYKSEVAYAKISSTIPEKKPEKDIDGNIVEGSDAYSYTFDFVRADGSKEVLGYDVTGSNPTPLTSDGYIKAEISKKRIVKGPNEISENDVPEDILAELNK